MRPRPLVLVVEDNPAVLGWINNTLQGAKFDVVTATTCAEGMDRLDQAVPDVAVVDIDLPDVSGLMVVEMIRQRVEDHAVPILIYSATPRNQRLHDAEFAGATDYLEKPAPREELIARVKKLLESS